MTCAAPHAARCSALVTPEMRRFNRPFRRAFRTGMFGRMHGPTRQLGERAREALDEANRLFDAGQFGEAADLLAELAEGAQAHGMPRRAAQLHLRAGQAYLQARSASAAVHHSREAFAIFAAAGMGGRAAMLVPRLIAELRSAGFNAEAGAFEHEANEKLGARGFAPPAPHPAPRPLDQPTKCPQCGAQLRWLDRYDDEVECEYCGTIVRAD